jgi:hypothetical protein
VRQLMMLTPAYGFCPRRAPGRQSAGQLYGSGLFQTPRRAGPGRTDTGRATNAAGALTRPQALKPMSGFQHYSMPKSCSVARTFGELQVTGDREHVVVEVQSRNCDTIGRLYCEHALARLLLQKALKLRDLLDRAIEASRATLGAAQPAVWSNSAFASVAGELWRRRRA